MHSSLLSATTIGIDAHRVDVEVDVSPGLINFYIVGLPDTAIKESSKRILTALANSGIRLPAKKITVNLAPADLKKEGTLFDLPIALGILLATKHIPSLTIDLAKTLFLGELSLDGSIRSIRGALAIACDTLQLGINRIILPQANVYEAACIEGLEVIGVAHLTELIAYLKGEHTITPTPTVPLSSINTRTFSCTVLDDIKGQHQAKRALEIAAAGKHNIVLIGPPGSGKTMLAKTLPGLMPVMSADEIIKTSKIYSVTGKLDAHSLITQRPFRSPHHTISQAGLVGGGSYPQPGEISLAHHGILFLDELTEFKRHTIEALRQPLESKEVSIARANNTLKFPASFLLVGALNPCPCGFFGDRKRQCVCSIQQVGRYMEKLSGPFMDRIDLHIYVQPVDYQSITHSAGASTHESAMARIEQARTIQINRFGYPQAYNGEMTSAQIEQFCVLTPAAQQSVKRAFEALNLSMRGYHKLLKVARTIADLDHSELIDLMHVQEALMYRSSSS